MKTKAFALLLTLLLVFTVSMAVSAETMPSGETAIVQVNEVSGQGEALSQAGESGEDDALAVPEPPKSTNTPYFIGAGIAVLVFIGVAFYCKYNGNKIL